MATARVLVRAKFTTEDWDRTLHRHRGAFWRWTGSCYELVEDEVIKSGVWDFLEKSRKLVRGKPAPFKPVSDQVSNVFNALVAVTQLDVAVEPPAWLDGRVSPATESLSCGNGLPQLRVRQLYRPTPQLF